jgi:hypothetical protein
MSFFGVFKQLTQPNKSVLLLIVYSTVVYLDEPPQWEGTSILLLGLCSAHGDYNRRLRRPDIYHASPNVHVAKRHKYLTQKQFRWGIKSNEQT